MHKIHVDMTTEFRNWWYTCRINYQPKICRISFNMVGDLITVTSPTTPPKINTGRRRRPTSRNTPDQNNTVALKLSDISKSAPHGHPVNGPCDSGEIVIVPLNAANAVVQHVVYALMQDLFLEQGDGPVVRQQPWTSTRGWIWVRRGAEDGTCDALNGR